MLGLPKESARSPSRLKETFIEIPRQGYAGRVPFTEAEFTAMRGGLTAEEYRWKTIRPIEAHLARLLSIVLDLILLSPFL